MVNTNTLATSTSTQSAADFTVQATLDVWYPQGPSQVWNNISTTHYSSANPDGAMLYVYGPIAGLRLNSSTWTSGSVNLVVLETLGW